MNQQLYKQLLYAGEVLAYRDAVECEAERIQEEIKRNNVKVKSSRSKLDELLYPKKKRLKVFVGIVAAIASLPLILAAIGILAYGIIGSALVIAEGEMSITGEGMFAVLATILVCIGGALLFLLFDFLPLTLMFLMFKSSGVFGKRKRKRALLKHEELEAEMKEKNDALTEELRTLGQAWDAYSEENWHHVEFLPEDYQHTHAVGYMLKAVKNFRADSLKEAINLYYQEFESLAAIEQQRIMNEDMLYVLEEINESIERNTDTLVGAQLAQAIYMFGESLR